MGGALLTDEEKRRFSEWLQIQIDSGKGMAEQMEKMSGAVGAELVKREQIKIAAYLVVYKEINSGESWQVG